MSSIDPTHFARMQQRYRTCDLPWDNVLPPPEVIALANRLAPGQLIDLGCDTARASVYLAAQGWEADAIDFVPEAIELARARVQASGQGQRVRLHLASVTDLHVLDRRYDLAIDVGCLHGLAHEDQQRYAAEVARLVRPGGTYLLFTYLREYTEDAVPIGSATATIEALFGASFTTVQVAYGETVIGDTHWRSAWYELMRQ